MYEADYKLKVSRFCLYAYEKGEGRMSPVWANLPGVISGWRPGGAAGRMFDEDFGNWAMGKRAFRNDEVSKGSWVKVGDNGQSFIVQFRADGTLTERSLFDSGGSWQGSWQLVDGALRMNVDKYELHIIAVRDDFIHSGVEFMRDQSNPYVYFKVFHLE